MTEHTVKAYEHELHDLAKLVIEAGAVASKQLQDSIEALSNRNEALAGRVIASDETLDELQRRIEATAIQIIGKRQPLANDLRDVVGAMRISIDLERIGDFAKNIGKRVSALGQYSYPNHAMKRIQHMADLALLQIKNVLDSYEQHDGAKAVLVWKNDEEIDAMNTSLFRELLTYMMEEPRNITFSIHMLFCAKNLERIGDHATNIAETVYYMVHGEPLHESRPKGPSIETQ